MLIPKEFPLKFLFLTQRNISDVYPRRTLELRSLPV